MASVQSGVDWQSTKKTVSERTRHMFNNSDMSDISFAWEGSDKILYVHKYVLGTSSAVFHAMFYGGLAEKNSVLHLSDTDEKSLEEFLKFLYTDECNLTTDNVISIMYLSKKYIVPSLTKKCVNFLERSITAENVTSILAQATHFDEKKLETTCWKFIESNTKEVVASEDFNNISQKTLASLLSHNDLHIVEVELFQAVLKWSDFHCSKKAIEPTRENRRSVIGDAIYDLRFLAMNEKEFAKNVATSGLLTAEEMIPIYNKFNEIDSPDLKWKLSAKRPISSNVVFGVKTEPSKGKSIAKADYYCGQSDEIESREYCEWSEYREPEKKEERPCKWQKKKGRKHANAKSTAAAEDYSIDENNFH